MNYLNLNYVFLEFDQAIFTKVLQVLIAFQENKNIKFEKILMRMGGFHEVY